MYNLKKFDEYLTNIQPRPQLKGLKRFYIEFIFFGIKQARASLFATLFFASVFLVPRAGVWMIPRYDLLLIIAILIQLWMLCSKLETWDEMKAICVFHVVGFLLEVFKTSPAIGAWQYPDFGYTKIMGVPLFAGFMHAAVGSYIIQAWRIFDLRIQHHPAYWMTALTSLLIYVNFFSHHFIPDYRWYLSALILGLYARSTVTFRPFDEDRKMPLIISFILIGFFIWLAENISTFFRVWQYPNQLNQWSLVHLNKWTSWSLLVIITFTIVAHLKHIKKSIHVPE